MFGDTELDSILFLLTGFLLVNAIFLMIIKFFFSKKPSKYGDENNKPGRRSLVMSMIFILLLVLFDVIFIIYMIPALRGFIEDKLDFITRLI